MWVLLQTHYSKHHQAYVSKLNGEASSWAGKVLVCAAYRIKTTRSLAGGRTALFAQLILRVPQAIAEACQSRVRSCALLQAADRPPCSLVPLCCKACSASTP